MPIDLSKFLTEEGGNYKLDPFEPKLNPRQPLWSYNKAFTNNLHTLFLGGHGLDQEGTSLSYPSFSLSPTKSGTNSFGLTDVANTLGSKTNSIHNLILASCGSGGCAPQEAFKLFPNLTNVVASASGKAPMYRDLLSVFPGSVEYALGGGTNNLWSFQKQKNPLLGIGMATKQGKKEFDPYGKRFSDFNTNSPVFTSRPFDMNRMLGVTNSSANAR